MAPLDGPPGETPDERRRRKNREAKQRQRARELADQKLSAPIVLSDNAQAIIDQLAAERKLTIGEELLARQVALCNEELREFDRLLSGEELPWVRALRDALDVDSITLNVDQIHAAIDRKRSTLARLLSELRQYGVAAAKANAQRSAAPAAIPAPADSGRAQGNSGGDDEYSDLFATG